MKKLLFILLLFPFAAQSQTITATKYRQDSTMCQRMFSVQQKTISELSARLLIEENKRIVVVGATVSNDSIFIPKPVDLTQILQAIKDINAGNVLTQGQIDILKLWMDKVKATFQ